MDTSSTESGERDTPLVELAAAMPSTGLAPEWPAWQQIVSTIREEDKTPTVRLLLRVIEELSQRLTAQARRIEALEAEVARLKGDKQKPRSNSKPSGLNKPLDPIPARDGKRPGSEKRSKTEHLKIHREVSVAPEDLPESSTFT